MTFLELGQQATGLQLPVTHEDVKVAKPEEAKVSRSQLIGANKQEKVPIFCK